MEIIIRCRGNFNILEVEEEGKEDMEIENQNFSLDFVIRKHRELSDKPEYIHFFKTFLYCLSRVDLHVLHQSLENLSFEIDDRLKDLITMIANLRLFRPVEIVRKNDRDFYHLRFRDKGLDNINISAILRNNNVLNKIPIYWL